MSTTDRVCPTHGDIGSLLGDNNCSKCGAKLQMKGIFRTTGENIIHGAAVGLGVGVGLEVAHDLMDEIGDLLS